MSAEMQAVLKFWQEASCGETYAKGETLEEAFASQARARYELEPYLKPFARFDGMGRAVLEIGVGMGADHAEWARSSPDALVGVDLTPRALDWTRRRLEWEGFETSLHQADAEALPFRDGAFDTVYSWGVIHHSPDTPRAVEEIRRVLRPGGIARIMIYHRPSVVGLLLWARYGLGRGRPFTPMRAIYSEHLESPGTKGYTTREARHLFEHFSVVATRTQVSLGDLLEGEVGQRHRSPALEMLKKVWPRRLVRRLRWLGLFLMIEATK